MIVYDKPTIVSHAMITPFSTCSLYDTHTSHHRYQGIQNYTITYHNTLIINPPPASAVAHQRWCMTDALLGSAWNICARCKCTSCTSNILDRVRACACTDTQYTSLFITYRSNPTYYVQYGIYCIYWTYTSLHDPPHHSLQTAKMLRRRLHCRHGTAVHNNTLNRESSLRIHATTLHMSL